MKKEKLFEVSQPNQVAQVATPALVGNKRELTPARASEKSPLELFAEGERSRLRRRRRRKDCVVPHLRYGRFDRALERFLEREKPELREPDDAEIERLLAKHADIARA